jgi:hypothetical protein
MAMQRSSLFRRQSGASAPLICAIGFVLALLQALGCSTSGSTSDGSSEGGHGGGGGMSTGGASGDSGHPGSGGASGGSSGGAAGNAVGGASGGVGGNAAGGMSGGGGGSAGKAVGGGSGGTGGNQMFSCGSDTCTIGESFCYSYTPGTAGPTGLSCEATPAACSSTPASCACLCPPSSNTAFGCVPAGMGAVNFCSCTDTGGVVHVSCAGA